MPIRNLFVYPRTDLMQIYMANKDYSIRQEQLARFAKAMGHPARIAILQFLAKQETCYFGDIHEELPIAKATVSQHLEKPRDFDPFGQTGFGPLWLQYD